MVRIIISMPEKDVKMLDRLAKKNKRSRADLVRGYVGEGLKKESEEPTWKEIVAKCAGMWKHKNIDTDTYLEQLRSEWER